MKFEIVLKYIKERWPKAYKFVDNRVKAYYKVQNDELLFINGKVNAPSSLGKYMLQIIQEAHFGIENYCIG